MIEDSKNGPIMIDFTASWCGPCKLMAPIIDQINEEFGDKMKVYVFDVDGNKGRAKELGIKGLPYVQVFKDGEKMPNMSIEGMPKNAKDRLTTMAKSVIN
jgi:thioredoxin 1